MQRKFVTERRSVRGAGHDPMFRSAMAIRGQWRTLLDAARKVSGGAEITKDDLGDFNHLCLRTRAASFPVQGATVGWMVEAVLRMGRAYVEAGLPELRETYAPALYAGAEALERLLDDQRAAMAVGGRRVMGEAD